MDRGPDDRALREQMPFRSVFVAVTVSGALLLAALLINHARPQSEVRQPLPELVRASGRCAQCHREETPAIVHQFERNGHSRVNVTCLDCHQPHDGQETYDHYNFQLARDVTSLNCRACHRTEYEQFARSRHALPAWAAVSGTGGMSPEQIAFGERHHPGAVDRPPNALAALEGAAATRDRLPGLPPDRPAEPRRFHRKLHGVPLAAFDVDRAGARAADVRAVPHGARPRAGRDLHRVEARCAVRGATRHAEPERPNPSG